MSCEKCDKCQACQKSTHRSEDEKKKITKRLNIIEGQVRGIKQMIADDRYCDDVLIQILAVKKSLESLANNILSCHLKGCVTRDLQNGNIEVIDELNEVNDKYSKIPVYEENIDQIKGVVYTKDIVVSQKNKNAKIKALVKDAYYVPESKLVDELFEELRKTKRQIAIVIDEYGGTAGIVTMEDILEEIVGEIYDEYDEVEEKYEKLDENTYMLSGNLAMYEVEKILDISVQEGDYDTLSGYLTELLGRIPNDKEKTVIETEKVTYKIEKCKAKRIIKVKACKNNVVEEAQEEE